MSLKQPNEANGPAPSSGGPGRMTIAVIAVMALTIAGLGGYLVSSSRLLEGDGKSGGSVAKADIAGTTETKKGTATR